MHRRKNTKPKVVFLEGPDGAGKTTLAETLSKWLAYHHEGPRLALDEFALCQHYSTLWSAMPEVTTLRRADLLGIIVDRFELSERIYAPILGRVPRVNVLASRRIWRETNQNLDVLRVMLLPNKHTCIQRAFTRGESLLTEKQVSSAWDEYAKEACESRSWHVDSSNTGFFAKQLIMTWLGVNE